MRFWYALIGAVALSLSGAPQATAEDPRPRNVSFDLGAAAPSGAGTSDNYGSVWLNARLQYRLAETGSLQHQLALGVAAGNKERKFDSWDVNTGATVQATADFRARFWTLGYNLRLRTGSIFYLGGGADLALAQTESEWDAGENRVWVKSNGDRTTQKVTVSENELAVAPMVFVGAEFAEKFGVELRYTMTNATLAATSTDYTFPNVPASKLDSLLTLTGSYRF